MVFHISRHDNGAQYTERFTSTLTEHLCPMAHKTNFIPSHILVKESSLFDRWPRLSCPSPNVEANSLYMKVIKNSCLGNFFTSTSLCPLISIPRNILRIPESSLESLYVYTDTSTAESCCNNNFDCLSSSYFVHKHATKSLCLSHTAVKLFITQLYSNNTTAGGGRRLRRRPVIMVATQS